MSSSALCPLVPRIPPYHREPAVGQAIAVIVLLAGATGLTVWAGRSAVLPPPARAVSRSVSSAQLEAATMRIRYADAAATSAAFGGSASTEI